MKPASIDIGHASIVYDADRVPDVHTTLFDAEFWHSREQVTATARGRGETLMIRTPFGPAVLRRYIRGGVPAWFVQDRYFFTGRARSRPFREFWLLTEMQSLNLPAPAPLAALCDRSLLSYRGAILMSRVPGVPLTAWFDQADPADRVWRNAGATIAQFHAAGVSHADLNVSNILVQQEDAKIYLVDFDRGRLNRDRRDTFKGNMSRLKRSFMKQFGDNRRAVAEKCWKALLDGYHD